MNYKRTRVQIISKLTHTCESWKIFVFNEKLLPALSENDGQDCTLNSKQSFQFRVIVMQ